MTYLTKSRFKIGLDCPTKLYYYNHPNDYSNKSIDDPFLLALADGGFQVGELAKKYYPSNHEIGTRNHKQAALETSELLKQDNITIHEASFLADNKLFIKVDILKKKGRSLKLIEVKAKSFYSSKPDFQAKRGAVSSNWKDYIYDLAFQYYVVSKALPDCEIKAYLLMADKDKTATIDGLNQMFKVKREGKEININCTALNKDALGEELLTRCDLTELVKTIIGQASFEETGKSFIGFVNFLADICIQNKKIYNEVSKVCKSCQFVENEFQPGLKNGYLECWKNAFPNLSNENITEPKYYDIWNYRKKLPKERIFMKSMEASDIGTEVELQEDSMEMTAKYRQWLQLRSVKQNQSSRVIHLDGLKEKIDQFIYPFHFIDFETIRTAIPFNKGLRPYEQVAFQFSHHILEKDGSIYHANEWINEKQGTFPNFEFLRQLKKAIEHREGTIFRYSHHENTVLNEIRDQLQYSSEPDKNDLIDFILQLTTQKDEKGKILAQGERNMQDLCEIIKKYYYHPLMGGSNSIKKVLPAILNDSEYLKEKYSIPVYGTASIPSKNYSEMTWIKLENNRVKDPYQLLESFYDTITDELINNEAEIKQINDGGAALVAYAEMQFSDMSQERVEKRITALKKYCELDTLAMVMIMEELLYRITIQEQH